MSIPINRDEMKKVAALIGFGYAEDLWPNRCRECGCKAMHVGTYGGYSSYHQDYIDVDVMLCPFCKATWEW